MLKCILVATDFSARSDRAIRRAILLAKSRARIVLLHVIDDEQPPSLLKAEMRGASDLIRSLAHTMREVDGVACEGQVRAGPVARTIVAVAEEVAADLTVLGPYRRQLLDNAFAGTTAERAIRRGNRPVLMANGLPAGTYRHALFTTDLSPASAYAANLVAQLGVLGGATVTLAHAYHSAADSVLARSGMTDEQIRRQVANETAEAESAVARFAAGTKLAAGHVVARRGRAADTMRVVAGALSADLLVAAAHSRARVAKFFIGSVTENLLRNATQDVLVVPPLRHAATASS